MDLKVQTISGNVHSVSISTSANLLALYEAVGLAMDIKPWELRLTADARVLCFGAARVCRRTPARGCYNANYVCTVLQVRQVGWGMLDIDISVLGDGSLGGPQTPGPRAHGALPMAVTLDVDQEDQKQGTLPFENVPTSGEVSFIYGVNGYDPLVLNLDGR
ncbi:unnamed protein product [Symbiodinium natans]|uniref:Uncharacterized protein n=1 Tax=Symbiodinium natans TaxID=878477 RepID=A0A812MWY9_9DINO|nr:unnamed protein product [Symbiodinium natans]